MRISFLCSEYPPGRGGGIGTFTRTLGRALAARGHRVDVVGIYRRKGDVTEKDEGVTVHRLSGAGLPGTRFVRNGFRAGRKLRELDREAPIDIVEGQENAFASVRWRGTRAKRVIRMHGGHHFFAVTLGKEPALWRGWQERRSFERADAICAVSRYVAERTRELLGLKDRAVEILPNFVDTARFGPIEGIREEEGLILFVGTVCEKKGVKELVEAMPAIVAGAPGARLVIAGRDQQEPTVGGSYTEFLRGRISERLRERVEFLGPVPNSELPELLGRAAVCVFPSHMEAMPVAWLEAMACGKAVVASKAGPGPEVVDDGINGLLVDPRSPEEIAAAVVRCLKDPDLRARLGRAAREKVEREFSMDVLVERNLAFYRRVAGAG